MIDELDRLFDALAETPTFRPCWPPDVYWHGRFMSGWSRYPIAKHKPDTIYRDSDGKLHRLYGPAYVSGGYRLEEWYHHGEMHRVGGPARTHNGNTWWFENGKPHRLDGPAVILAGHPKEYWIGGSKISPKEYKKEIERRKRKGLIR